jgi:hypothetical protein
MKARLILAPPDLMDRKLYASSARRGFQFAQL